eukprot:4398033-Prymnesium_polylepis.1
MGGCVHGGARSALARRDLGGRAAFRDGHPPSRPWRTRWTRYRQPGPTRRPAADQKKLRLTVGGPVPRFRSVSGKRA